MRGQNTRTHILIPHCLFFSPDLAVPSFSESRFLNFFFPLFFSSYKGGVILPSSPWAFYSEYTLALVVPFTIEVDYIQQT